MAHIFKFHDQNVKSSMPSKQETVSVGSTETDRKGNKKKRESCYDGATGVNMDTKLRLVKNRLAELEQKYDELLQADEETRNWESLNDLLQELRTIMQVKGLEDVVEYQHGLAKIKSKVLRLQRIRQQQQD